MSKMRYNGGSEATKGSIPGPDVVAAARTSPLETEVNRARDDHARGDNAAALARLEPLLQGQEGERAQKEPLAHGDDRALACAWSLYGRILSAVGRDDDATAAFRQAVERFDRIIRPDTAESGVVRSDYGRALFRIGQWQRAIVELRRALELDYHTHDTLKYLGLALMMEQSPESERYLEQALSLRPDDIDTQVALALLRREPAGFIRLGHTLRTSNPDGAINAFRQAIELSPDEPDARAEALLGLGMVLLSTGKPAEAIEPLAAAAANPIAAYRANEYLAEAYRLDGRPEQALDAIERALALGQDFYALGTKGQILAALGRAEEAIDFLQRAAALEPSAEWILVDLLPLLREAHRLDEAAQLLLRLVHANDSAWAYQQLGAVFTELGRRDDAIDALLRAAELRPGNEVVSRALITMLRDAGREEDTLRHLESFVAAAPGSWWGYGELGESLRKLERYDDALAALDRALELSPDWGFALGTRGQILRARGELTAARELFDRALRADPSLRWVKEELVLTVEQLAGATEALALVDELLRDDPAWDRGHARRGAMLRGLGRFEEALPSLEEAVRLDGRDTFALQELGECLRTLNRLDDSLVTLDRALAIRPENAFAIASKAAVVLALDRTEEALELARRARAIDRNNTFALSVQSTALRILNRSEEAVEALREALTLRPDDVRLLGDLGETLRFMEREEEAVAVLDRALGLDPDNAFCLATRGYALRMLERYREGRQDLQRAVTLDDTYAWAHGALGHLLVEIAEAADAQRHAARAFELDSSLVWCRGVEGFARLLLGDLAGARDVMRYAHQHDPEELNWMQHLADTTLALGDRAAAEPLYRQVIARGSGATDPDTIARVAWSHRNVGEHDAAARTYQRAMTLPGRRLEYVRFDFALALLCGGRVGLALGEYERALQAIVSVDPLRARGLLVVARRDFELARRASQLADDVGAPVHRLLDDALARNGGAMAAAADGRARASELARAT